MKSAASLKGAPTSPIAMGSVSFVGVFLVAFCLDILPSFNIQSVHGHFTDQRLYITL